MFNLHHRRWVICWSKQHQGALAPEPDGGNDFVSTVEDFSPSCSCHNIIILSIVWGVVSIDALKSHLKPVKIKVFQKSRDLVHIRFTFFSWYCWEECSAKAILRSVFIWNRPESVFSKSWLIKFVLKSLGAVLFAASSHARGVLRNLPCRLHGAFFTFAFVSKLRSYASGRTLWQTRRNSKAMSNGRRWSKIRVEKCVYTIPLGSTWANVTRVRDSSA